MSRKVLRTWTQENTWPCPACGIKNPGRNIVCVSCGSPKWRETKDVVPTANPNQAVTDPALLGLASQGAHWKCLYCDGLERDSNGNCKKCGAERHEEDYPFEEARVKESDDANPPSSALPPLDQLAFGGLHSPGAFRSPSFDEDETPPPPPPKKPILPIALGIVGALIVISILLWIFIPRQIQTEITSITWKYTSVLHQKTLMHGDGWGNETDHAYPLTSKPDGYGPRSDSFNVMCEGKKSGTKECNPHNCNPHKVKIKENCRTEEYNCRTTRDCSDKQNGFSNCKEVEECDEREKCDEREETKYDTCYDTCNVFKDWCTYDYFDWPAIATKTTSGSDHKVFWPDLEAVGSDQRLDRTEFYKVTFGRDEKTWNYEPKSFQEFQTFETGASWTVKVNHAGQIWPIAPTP